MNSVVAASGESPTNLATADTRIDAQRNGEVI